MHGASAACKVAATARLGSAKDDIVLVEVVNGLACGRHVGALQHNLAMQQVLETIVRQRTPQPARHLRAAVVEQAHSEAGRAMAGISSWQGGCMQQCGTASAGGS